MPNCKIHLTVESPNFIWGRKKKKKSIFFYLSFFLSKVRNLNRTCDRSPRLGEMCSRCWIKHFIPPVIQSISSTCSQQQSQSSQSSPTAAVKLHPGAAEKVHLVQTIEQHLVWRFMPMENWPFLQRRTVHWVFSTKAVEYRIHPKAIPVQRKWNINSQQSRELMICLFTLKTLCHTRL